MNFQEYQTKTKSTAIYPEVGTGSLTALSYCALGLAGEAGEIANKVKKLLRDGDSPEKREIIKAEAGDVLWYLSQLLDELRKFSLECVAEDNVEKLLGRRARGTLHGEGDNR